MRATFYEALEVPSTAETPVIRAALRAILRRFWSVPRDPSGDTEEAVRFVALGAAILTDNARREAYEVDARRGATVNPWRVGNDGVPLGGGDPQALGIVGSHGGESAQHSGASSEPKLIPTVRALTDPLPEHTLWASTFGYALSGVVLAAAALLAYFSATLWLSNAVSMLIMLAVLIAGVFAALQTKIVTTELSGFTLSRLAVTKWRRETSVFVGNPAPAQDTAWIFRLRVMELTRSTSGYSSAPHIGLRLLARLADYALITTLVLLLLAVVLRLVPDFAGVIALIRSPIFLPAIVVFIAIPIEAVTTARFRMTPGKYLLGVVVASAVTQPDDQPNPARASLARARAFAFARDGASFGVWPIALLRWRAIARTIRVDEGAWEAAGDSVTLLRASPLFMRAAGISLVIACALALIAIWSHDVKSSFTYLSGMASKASTAGKANVKDMLPNLALPNLPTLPSPSASDAAPAPAPATKSESAPISPTPSPSAAATSSTAAIAAPSRSDVIIAPKLQRPIEPSASQAVPKSATKTDSSKVAAPPSDFDRQTAIAQERRNRIDAVERRVAAARATGSYVGLQGACERWTNDQPGSAEAWRCLGLAKFQAGAGRDALPALRQYLKIEPNDSQVEDAILKILRP
jgi:uncharacterized RDD family membrane protein YckC